jgi:hypothetical protein
MSIAIDQTPERSAAGAENIWPRRAAGLRRMNKLELEELTTALEKPVDQDHLEYWVSTAISNAVKLSSLPSPGQARDELKRIASEGREWIDQVDSDPIKTLLIQKVLQENNGLPAAVTEHRTQMRELKLTMTRICKQADSAAAELGRFIRRGGKRSTPPALINFLGTMIGIAKWNGILPSTPQRAMNSRKPPAFFVFVEKALSTARNVIESSQIPNQLKGRTVQSLHYASRDALIRILERQRGRIREYRQSRHGRLIRDTSRERRAGPGQTTRG